MGTDWQMPRAGRACAACARVFDAGEVLSACLYEGPGGYERRDFCLPCTPPQPAPVAAWKVRRPAATGRAAQPVDRAALYRFFARLEDAAAPEQAQLRFVLALLLWRQRVLKLEDTSQADGREAWRFTVRGADTTHTVLRPDLTETQLEQLSTQLEQLLAGGLVGLEERGAEPT